MKPYSIVRRLIVVTLCVELLAAVLVSVLAFGHEKHERFQTFNVMLRGRADSLLGAVQQAGDEADTVMLDGTETRLPRDDLYIVMAQGKVLGRSANWTEEQAAAALSQVPDRRRKGTAFPFMVHGIRFEMVRIEGVRMVDPGEKGGGIARPITIVYGSPTRHVWHEVDEAVEFYAIMSVGVMIMTGLVMAWLLRRGLAPLTELQQNAATVSVSSWDFVPSERVMATNELRPLGLALRDVLAGLKESFLKQERFVGDAAHELKTGVAVVKSSLQLTTMRERTPAEYIQGLERAQADCERMESMVARMLLLARLDHHEESAAAAQPTAIAPILEAAVEELSPMAAAHELQVALHLDANAMVLALPEDLRVIAINLIQNAIQHSAEGSTVRVVSRMAQGNVELCVEDHGEGIASDDLPHVFERFYRGDPSRSRNTGGTGLGLAIVQAIVIRLGGSIAIESEPGEGTTVKVLIPR